MARLTNIARFTPRSQKSEMVSSVCLTSLIQYNSSGSRILLRTYTRFSFVKSIAALIPNSPSLAESASFVIGLRLRSTSPVPGAATTIASFTGHITPTTLLRRQIIIFALPLSLAPSISRNSDPGSHTRKKALLAPPHYDSRLAFLSPKDFSFFFPRRLASNCASTHARRSQQLILFLFFFAHMYS